MNVFIFGWYGQNNLGDEIFKESFYYLFPNADLTFGNVIPPTINSYDALWIGGGSFLDQPIDHIDSVNIPIYFIGVGINPVIPDCNKRALLRAKLIVCRDGKSFELSINKKNTCLASDLVFARDIQPLQEEKEDQITVILNDFLTPVGGTVPDWRSLSYYWFLQEFSKIMDRYALQGYKIKLIPMCVNPRFDDRRIAAAVQGRSVCPHKYDWVLSPVSELELRTEISKSAFVITQRFHGLVYSIIEQTHCLTICTHDKFNSLIKDLNISGLDYYGLTDVKFRESLGRVTNIPFEFGSYRESAKILWESIRDKIIFNENKI